MLYLEKFYNNNWEIQLFLVISNERIIQEIHKFILIQVNMNKSDNNISYVWSGTVH